MAFDGSPGSQSWSWKSLDSVSTTRNDIDQLKDLLKTRNVNSRRGNDSLIWASSKTGLYNPRDGYRVLFNNVAQDHLDFPKKLFWSSKVIPKAGIFAWLAYQKKILTGEKFIKMGFAGPSRCILCKSQSETVDHLLLSCLFAFKCW